MTFDDIRPYQDHEVADTVKSLVCDTQFLTMLLRMRFGYLPTFCLKLLLPVLRVYLHKQAKKLTSIDDIQSRVCGYVEWMLNTTVATYSVSGIDQLRSPQARLFLSTHRDIVLDPALVNYALHRNTLPTAQIAIGDNLLQVPFITRLMRLNKSFLVRRGAGHTVKEKYTHLRTLSHYIHHVIGELKQQVWIAQREGRAKNGIDKTDISVLKMFCLHTKKQLSTQESLAQLHIVPVAISYEWDPCDVMKAQELVQQAKTGSYTKQPLEDIQSIKQGIVGHKGDVHVSFCPPLQVTSDDLETTVHAIDTSIIAHYRLMRTNYAAYLAVCREQQYTPRLALLDCEYTPEQLDDTERQLRERATEHSEGVVRQLMQSYANPVFHALSLLHGITHQDTPHSTTDAAH